MVEEVHVAVTQDVVATHVNVGKRICSCTSEGGTGWQVELKIKGILDQVF
jgi:hypothetical protein